MRLRITLKRPHPELVGELDPGGEPLLELGGMYVKAGRHQSFIEVLNRLRAEFPEEYIRSFPYFDNDMISWAIINGKRKKSHLNNKQKKEIMTKEKRFILRCYMRVTTKGQVTIPRNIREKLGIIPETDIDFKEDNGRFYIVKTTKPKLSNKFNKFRGIASAKMTTDEILHLTREI